MKNFFKIIFLVMLTVTNGFTAERLVTELGVFKQGSKITSRMTGHIQPLKLGSKEALQFKQREINDFHPSSAFSKRGILSERYNSPFAHVQKRFHTTFPKNTEKTIEDRSQSYAIPTYDGTFKYVMHDKKICLSFLNTFTENETIVDIDYMDSHLRPFKEYQIARTFINDSKAKEVMDKVNGFVSEQGAKDESFSVSFTDKNSQQTLIKDGGWFIRGLSDIYGDIVKNYPKPERNSQVDILCHTRDSYTLVEVQIVPQDYWDERALAYAANIFARQLKEGDKWKDIKKVICINILGGGSADQAWTEKEMGFTRYAFKDQNNKEIEKGIEILQYPLFHEETKRIADKKGQKKEAYLEWLDFFEHASKKKAAEVNSLKTEEVRMAYEKIKSSNLPQEVIEENKRQEAEFFENYSRHIEYLKQEAKIEAKIEIAKSLLNRGIAKDVILEVTGLLSEEIDKLEKEIGKLDENKS